MSPSPTKDKSKSDKRKKDGEEGGGIEKEDKSPPSKQSKQVESPAKPATKTDSTRQKISVVDSSSGADKQVKLKVVDTKAAAEAKKVKTIQEIKKAELKKVDVYQEIQKIELSESVDRDREEDAKMFKEIMDNIRTKLGHIYKIRVEGNPEDTKDIKVELGLLFVKMKKLNRMEKLRLRTARENTNSSKQKVDAFNLQLQNLRYEVLHLKKEVSRCINFWSADEDVDLVDINTFYADAPKDVSKSEITRENPHQLRLARLVWELQTRKKLHNKANELEEERNSLDNVVTAKDEKLKELGKHLKNMLTMSKPVQEILNLPLDMERTQKRLLAMLPAPLHYMATCAGIMVQHNESASTGSENPQIFEFTIEGDERKAREWTEEEVEGEEHPLKVVFKLKTEAGDEINLMFSYLLPSKLVCVKTKVLPKDATFTGEVLQVSSLMNNFYPENLIAGSEAQQAEQWISEKLGKSRDDVCVWVQKVSGISMGPGASADQDQTQTVHLMKQIIHSLRERFENRLSLQEQINLLAQGKSFKQENVPKQIVNRYPPKVKSKLKSLESFTWEQFCQGSEHSSLVKDGHIDSNDFLFKCVITRGIATLTGLVAVKNDYPQSTPIFILTLAWKDRWNSSNNEWIRDLESEINVQMEESDKDKNILIHQVYKLTVLLDVMLECISAMDPEPLFAKEHNFEIPVEGRQRKLPLVYDHINNFFHPRA